MGLIADKANAIAADMAKNDSIKKYAIDPFTIITVIGVIVDVIKLVYECYKDHHQAAQVVQNPGLVERWRLRKVIKNHIGDDEAHAALGKPMFHSTLNVSKAISPEECDAMYNEALIMH